MADPIDAMQPVHFEGQEKEPIPMAKKKSTFGLKIVFALVVVLAGIGSGYALAQFSSPRAAGQAGETVVPEDTNQVKVGAVFGAQDENKYKDNAEGVLVSGGIDGEGSHHLLRDGGPSRNVYMTSSVLDLALFEGAKVKVWGETFASQKAGWLMDVGRVQVIELNAAKPFEEPGQTQVLEGE